MIITFHIQYIHIVISRTRDSHTHTAPMRTTIRHIFRVRFFELEHSRTFFLFLFFFIFTKDLRLWSFSDDFIFLGNSCSILVVIL